MGDATTGIERSSVVSISGLGLRCRRSSTLRFFVEPLTVRCFLLVERLWQPGGSCADDAATSMQASARLESVLFILNVPFRIQSVEPTQSWYTFSREGVRR